MSSVELLDGSSSRNSLNSNSSSALMNTHHDDGQENQQQQQTASQEDGNSLFSSGEQSIVAPEPLDTAAASPITPSAGDLGTPVGAASSQNDDNSGHNIATSALHSDSSFHSALQSDYMSESKSDSASSPISPTVSASSDPSSDDYNQTSLQLDVARGPQPAAFGVDKIWVHEGARRKRIANRLVDAARERYSYWRVPAPAEIAFSQPTWDGRKFARHYTGRADFLAYT